MKLIIPQNAVRTPIVTMHDGHHARCRGKCSLQQFWCEKCAVRIAEENDALAKLVGSCTFSGLV